jgi:hypothetical protein
LKMAPSQILKTHFTSIICYKECKVVKAGIEFKE